MKVKRYIFHPYPYSPNKNYRPYLSYHLITVYNQDNSCNSRFGNIIVGDCATNESMVSILTTIDILI